MKTAMIGLVALLACGNVAQGEEVKVETKPFALDFSAQVDYFAFDNELYVVTPSVGFTLFEVLDATVSLPVYNTSEEQGIGGDLNFGVEYGLLQDKTGLFGSDASTLSVNGQFGLPLGGEYASENYTFTVGAAAGLNWGKVAFNQDVSYLFNTGETFVPVFGGFLDTEVLSATSSISYELVDSLKIGADFSQYYAGDAQLLTLGPSVEWAISDTASLDVGVGFVLDQDAMPYGDLDYTVSAGLGFKF